MDDLRADKILLYCIVLQEFALMETLQESLKYHSLSHLVVR
jgi:hypothetical protein